MCVIKLNTKQFYRVERLKIDTFERTRPGVQTRTNFVLNAEPAGVVTSMHVHENISKMYVCACVAKCEHQNEI